MRQLTALIFAGAAICVVSAAAQSPGVQSPTVQSPGVTESGSRPTQTVWSGVYSESQAYRGEKVADTTCIGCHGPKLDGGDSGPKLVGETFLANWSSQSVGELFDWLREAMPAEAPGTLSREDAAAVIAYIFKLNNIPAGKVDLPTEREALGRINIVADKPAARVPGTPIARLDGTTMQSSIPQKLGVLLMNSSDNAESIFGHLLTQTIADTSTPLEWENYVAHDAHRVAVTITRSRSLQHGGVGAQPYTTRRCPTYWGSRCTFMHAKP